MAGDGCEDACSSDDDCSAGFSCTDKVCSRLQPDGSVCGTNDAACASGHCVEGVCCNAPCDDGCQSCTLKGSLGACGVKAVGAACDGGDSACVDEADKSYLKVPQCDGTSTGCSMATTSDCGPYRCADATSCRTSCTDHSHCSSGVCDLSAMFGAKHTCATDSQICFVDASAPAPGSGTRQSPYASIQACLSNTMKTHIAVADGTYNETITIARQVALWGTGASGSFVDRGIGDPGAVKAVIQAPGGSIITVTKAAIPGVVIWGIRATRAQAGSHLPPLIDVKSNGDMLLRSVDITKNGGPCFRATRDTGAATVPTVTLEDVALSDCHGGLDARGVNIDLRDAAVMFLPTGTAVYHSGTGPDGKASLFMHDVHIGYSGSTATPMLHGVRVENSNKVYVSQTDQQITGAKFWEHRRQFR